MASIEAIVRNTADLVSVVFIFQVGKTKDATPQ
jgi:hypothetical protein